MSELRGADDPSIAPDRWRGVLGLLDLPGLPRHPSAGGDRSVRPDAPAPPRFLAALGEDGPFLLLGASFGGLVASAYAVAHPDRVAGVVLLDASTGVDYDLDEMQGFQGACLEANRQADAWDSLEKLDNCSLAEWIHDRRDREPDVPLRYLAAQDPSDRGSEAEDAVRIAWVESWSPGTWRVVNAPHWMEEADTGLVADAVREVIQRTH